MKLLKVKQLTTKNTILFLRKDMMSRLIRGSKAKQSTTSKKKIKIKILWFILFLKSKDKSKIKEIVKNLPTPIINSLSEVVLNGLCGNIPLNNSDIEKLKPFKKLMKSLSNKSNKVGLRKKLMTSKKGGSLLSIILPLAATAITSLISK